MNRNLCQNCKSNSGTSTQQERSKQLVLRLQEAPDKKPKVTWTEDTVNNEGCGKKSSKRINALCVVFMFASFEKIIMFRLLHFSQSKKVWR